MTNQRAAITEKLKSALQQEVDRLQLGLEIVFVGLKDVHPPVALAVAHQDVVSAQELKESLIDRARAGRARAVPEAKAQTDRLRVQEDASYRKRVAAATGEA